MGYGVIRNEPMTIEVRKGEVVKATGGKGADYLNETLKSFNDRKAYNLAEFAVGFNPYCRTYATNVEALGKLGTGHHGIGSNYAIGGSVQAPCHIDVSYLNACLEIDGKLIYDKGKILI
jgi:leucyl aminopeptidase (aminopeptidase T)